MNQRRKQNKPSSAFFLTNGGDTVDPKVKIFFFFFLKEKSSKKKKKSLANFAAFEAGNVKCNESKTDLLSIILLKKIEKPRLCAAVSAKKLLAEALMADNESFYLV